MDLVGWARQVRRKMTPEQRSQTYQRISEPSKASGPFYLMVCLSTIIAALGMLANNTAVVIGAMLVAPLMSPIFGIALGLTMGDRQLLKTASLAEVGGLVLAIGLPLLIGLIPLRPDFGTEILGRTQPTIYDILVALASGVAGAYALVDVKISPALPGVAIATALVPPLASCGLNIASANWTLAWGAFLLFAVNFIAIEFAAASVFTWFGMINLPRASNDQLLKTLFERLGISFLILIIAVSFMTKALIDIVQERKLANDIRTVLAEQLSSSPGAGLTELKVGTGAEGLQVIATVVTPREFEPYRVAQMESALQSNIDPDARLIVRSVVSRDADRSGPVFVSQQELALHQQRTEEANYMNKVSQTASEYINRVSGAQVTDVVRNGQDGISHLTVTVRTPQAMGPEEVQLMQEYLQAYLGEEIRLVVSSVITTDADADSFMHKPPDFAAALEGEDLDLYQRLTNEVIWYLSQQVEGIQLERLNFELVDSDTLQVKATIKTPITLGPSQVASLQEHLVQYIDPRIVITVNSRVGGTATAEDLFQITGD